MRILCSLLLSLILGMWPATGQALQRAQRKVLDNGLTLLLLEQHALPFVTVRLSVKAGAVYDPPGKEGLANLTAALLTQGSEQYTAQELAQAIEFVGGQISSSAGQDFAETSLTVLKKDLDLGFRLLGEVISRPTFTQEELDREKKETVGNIIQEKEDPAIVANKKFNQSLYGSHPYWHPVEGVEESVPQITRRDVTDFYRAYYAPNNSIMTVVGDITPARLDELLAKHFSPWAPKKVTLPPVPAPQALKAKSRELIDQKLTQATVLLGHIGISRHNPDYYALYVMNYILGGGGFASRLLTNIRDEKGLAYSAASYFSPGFYGGSFKATIQTKNENAKQVIEATLDEIKRIRQEMVFAEELAAAKSYLTGSFPLKLDTNSKIASYLAFIENYGLGLDYFEKFPQKIKAVSGEKILEVAQKYLDQENYLTIVVADQEKAGLKDGNP